MRGDGVRGEERRQLMTAGDAAAQSSEQKAVIAWVNNTVFLLGPKIIEANTT